MIKITPNSQNTYYRMPVFNCIAVGRAYELLREDLLKHLRFVQKELKFKYCRFHALFHDDMSVVIRKPDGSIGYQWHHIDKIYDSLLDMGLRPFVELNPMPKALASGEQTAFWWKMNVTPPKTYEMWADLVEAFARHLTERYGIEEIRQWYFEVWNEPNLDFFWSGSKEDYWKLYDAAAFALKKVDKGLRVGGPASAGAVWITDIIEHCSQNNVPIDFVTTHVYPQGEYCDYPDRKGSPHEIGEYLADMVKRVYEEVKSSSMPHLMIHWTEWNTMSADSSDSVDWVNNKYVDNIFAASYIAKNCLKFDGLTDSMTYWTASDIFEETSLGHSPFSCTYGLVTIHGIPKASFNAMKMLRRLNGNIMNITSSSDFPAGCGISAVENAEKVKGLVWNHHMLEIKDQPVWNEKIRISVTKDTDYRVVMSTIKEGAGSAWETWCQMGKPHNLTPMEEELLWAHSQPEYSFKICTPENGEIELEIVLKPNEVMYFEAMAVGEPIMPKPAACEEIDAWAEGMDLNLKE